MYRFSNIKMTLDIGIKDCFIYILVQSHFELVSSVLPLEVTEPISEPVTQMAVPI